MHCSGYSGDATIQATCANVITSPNSQLCLILYVVTMHTEGIIYCRLGNSTPTLQKIYALAMCVCSGVAKPGPGPQHLETVEHCTFVQWSSQDIAIARAQHGHTTFVLTSVRSPEAYREVWGHPSPGNFTASQIGSEAIYRSEV